MSNPLCSEWNSRSPQSSKPSPGLRADVDLAAGVVEPHGARLFDEVGVEVLRADELEHRRLDVRVRQHRAAADAPAVDPHAGHLPVGRDFDLLDQRADADVDAVPFQLGPHLRDELVGPPLEREHPLAHEVREDDAVGDRRVFQRRAVGVGDRLHQQPDDVGAAGEEPLEQLAGGRRLIVVEVHLPGGVEELVHGRLRDAELLGEDPREVVAVEGRPQRELRILEADPLELHDRVGDLAASSTCGSS